MALGPDLVTGRSLVRSLTVRGGEEDARAALTRWAATAAQVRAGRHSDPGIAVADLLDRWLIAPHGWRPSTLAGYTSTVKALSADALGTRRAAAVTPQVLRAGMRVWTTIGVGSATIASRVRCLRSAFTWAYREGVLDAPPLRGMRGPATGPTRLHAPVETVRRILERATAEVEAARAASRTAGSAEAEVHRAEQVLLLARLAADTGARRGELAALQFGDLDGEVLTISRGTSNEIVGPTKSGRSRRLTLGAGAADLWRTSVAAWRDRATHDTETNPAAFGPWLFSTRPDHTVRLSTSCLGRWFIDLAARAGHPDVTLHRLRHTVATVLVGQGDLLQAQHRLGHRDASTTLRIYSHALPLTDADAAAAIDRLYR
ncbi:MAG: tyrosine-type recombinase/integrase [Actinomycetales bacterium]|nr:tyrosine-type recombinase/integrase [Actinomycetales bacterium]